MVSREQVLHVARLAKLRLSAEEEERFALQLGGILEYVDHLRELDAESVPAGGEPGDSTPDPRPLRADEPSPSLPRDEALGLAPATDGETFRVPPVIDGGGGA